MLKLSKKDRRIFWSTIIICLVSSYCLKSIFFAKNEFIITILTVIIGFILSAIAIIFSSSLRILLYDQKYKGYESLWHRLISICYYTFIFNLFFVASIAILPAAFPSWIIMGFFIHKVKVYSIP